MSLALQPPKAAVWELQELMASCKCNNHDTCKQAIKTLCKHHWPHKSFTTFAQLVHKKLYEIETADFLCWAICSLFCVICDCYSKIHKLMTVSFPADRDDDKGEEYYKPEAGNDEESGEGEDIKVTTQK